MPVDEIQRSALFSETRGLPAVVSLWRGKSAAQNAVGESVSQVPAVAMLWRGKRREMSGVRVVSIAAGRANG